MKKIMTTVLIVAVLLVATGIVGSIASNNIDGNRLFEGGWNYSRGRMMQYAYFSDPNNTGEKMDLETLKARVDRYISRYDETLVIDDVFLFADSDFYFSIMEEDTGLGAMELLVNPYTGDVYPEFGPNMMWNLKYGMHNNAGYGMMGAYSTGENSSADAFDGNKISREDAQKLASDYLDQDSSNEYKASEEGHEFYGYYTFHIEDANNIVGMLSVNGFTGEVWYHNWHGTVADVIEGHGE